MDEIGIQEVNNIGVLVGFHDNDFINDEFFLGLLLKIHLLDGNFHS